MSAYNFTPKGAFFINYKDPDRETVDHITSLYYLIIGSLATITQTAIKDSTTISVRGRTCLSMNLSIA